MVDKKQILLELKAYRDNMYEFDEDEMAYLIELVDRDIEYELLVKDIATHEV